MLLLLWNLQGGFFSYVCFFLRKRGLVNFLSVAFHPTLISRPTFDASSGTVATIFDAARIILISRTASDFFQKHIQRPSLFVPTSSCFSKRTKMFPWSFTFGIFSKGKMYSFSNKTFRDKFLLLGLTKSIISKAGLTC